MEQFKNSQLENFKFGAGFINLTQHELTQEQILELTSKGHEILTLTESQQTEVKQLLNFEDIPSEQEMEFRANKIAQIVSDVVDASKYTITSVMIGGAPYFMSKLQHAIQGMEINYQGKHDLGICVSCYYSFTKRVSQEHVNAQGETVKTSVFKHIGFVQASYF